MQILIAEDELYARKMIIKILRESNLDIEKIIDVDNGQKAKEYLQNNLKVDLIITDICMPELDGLGLSEYIFKSTLDINIIIITGYEEFDYARRAIEFQVKKLITKPVNKNILLNAINEVLEENAKQHQRIVTMANDFIKRISSQYISFKNIIKNRELMLKFLPITLSKQEKLYFRAMTLQLDCDMTDEDVETINKIFKTRFINKQVDSIYCKNNDEYVLVYCDTEENLGNIKIKQQMQNLISYIRSKRHYNISVGCGKVYNNIVNVYTSYKEAIYSINQRLIQGWNKVYVYMPDSQHEDMLSSCKENKLTYALRASNYEKAKQVIHEIFFDKYFLERVDINSLYDLIISILKILNEHYRSLNCKDIEREENIQIMFSRRYDLYSFKNMKELEDYFMHIIDEMKIWKEFSGIAKSSIINDILQYIKRSYQYDISLHELAEKKYFRNYSYLSRTFKTEVGETFSKYLIKLRINKSKELLLNSEMKISDIAMQVGYNDASHYIQSFKKICKITPEEFRIQQLNIDNYS